MGSLATRRSGSPVFLRRMLPSFRPLFSSSPRSLPTSIGDWYPERSFFQIFIALTSGPRFALVFLQYHMQRQTNKTSWPLALLVVGIVRSLSCGGWVYITSTDHHDVHDVLMVSYIICNVPWMLGSISCTSSTRNITKRRRFVGHTTRCQPYSCQQEICRYSVRQLDLTLVASPSWTGLDSLPPSSLWSISSSNTRFRRDPEVGVPPLPHNVS